MNKYRVLKPYPKQITNSGRLVTLKKGANVYLKKEGQILRLVSMGYLAPVVEMLKGKKKSKPVKQKSDNKSQEVILGVAEEFKQEYDSEKKQRKSEYLNKKKSN